MYGCRLALVPEEPDDATVVATVMPVVAELVVAEYVVPWLAALNPLPS
jgi:hypothetical protein